MDTEFGGFRTLAGLLRWCEAAPEGTSLDARVVAALLASVVDREPEETSQGEAESVEWTWRERLWVCPAETRLGMPDMMEALGRPRSWIYARTAKDTEDRMPHRKLDGMLTFTAGEVRAWIRAREETVEAGPMESTPAERRGHLHAV